MRTQFLSTCLTLALLAAATSTPSWGQSPIAAPPTSSTISDTDPGWIWDHMSSCDSSGPAAASSHAGGPGSAATYIFKGTGVAVYSVSGPSVQVRGSTHNLGTMRVSIDGAKEGDFPQYAPGRSANAAIFSVHNLQDGNHSLVLTSVDAWAAVSSLSIDHIATGSTSAPRSAAVLADGQYEIAACSTGNCLDCVAWGTTNGTAVQVFPYAGTTNQLWEVVNLNNGFYSIRSSNGGRALDCTDNSPNDGTFLQLWDYAARPCQLWAIHRVGGGQYILSTSQAKPGGGCDVLSTQNCSGANNTRVTLWGWLGGGCQQTWAFVPR